MCITGKSKPSVAHVPHRRLLRSVLPCTPSVASRCVLSDASMSQIPTVSPRVQMRRLLQRSLKKLEDGYKDGGIDREDVMGEERVPEGREVENELPQMVQEKECLKMDSWGVSGNRMREEGMAAAETGP
ncbi:unnamed protein product [Brugia pahangi]|uniref:Uncharacterized protein n=1 Tax=Brugia pahangi TaxID=6280 RepID=A0A0N4TUF1_BRUPA|nr:unnamed protein product [Brugia pahangi]